MSKKKPIKRRGRTEPAPAVLLVSYCPLLQGKPGLTFDFHKDQKAIQRITDQLAQIPSSRADACLWTLDDQNRPAPILVYENAVAIADHLSAWADNQPEKWFKVYLRELGGKYGLVLFPEAKQSLSRFKFTHLLKGGDPIETGKVQLITQPLHFVSGTGTAYARIKDQIGTTLQIGLLDLKHLDSNAPFELDATNIRWLGGFTVGDCAADNMGTFLDGIIGDATIPPVRPSQINPAFRGNLDPEK